MSFLDDFLLGRNRNRNRLGESLRRDTANARVTRVSPKGVAFEGVDRRASTLGAANALLNSTGSIPSGFFTGVTRETVIPFRQENGADFQLLQDNNIQAGSRVSDLFNVLQPQGNIQSTNTNANPANSRVGIPQSNPNNQNSNTLLDNSSINANRINALNNSRPNINPILEDLNSRPSDDARRARGRGNTPFGSRGGNGNANGNSEAGIDPRNFGNTSGTFLSSFIEDLFNIGGNDRSNTNSLPDSDENFNGNGNSGRDLRFFESSR